MFHNNNFNYGMNNQNINFNMNNNFNNQISYNNQMNNLNNNMNNLMINNQNNNNFLNNINQMNFMYNEHNFPINNNINIPNNNKFMNMNNNPNNLNFNNMNNHNYFLNQFNNMNLNEDIPQINQNDNINNVDFQQDQENSLDFEIEQNKNIQAGDLEVTEKLEINSKIEGIKVIYNQMNNCICDKGFFCILPYLGKKIPVFITSTEVLYDNFLKKEHEIIVSINYGKVKTKINLDENNILFKNGEFQILIIKINSNNNLTKNNFLEFDENLYENNHIYILNYNYDYNYNKQYSTVSFGYLVKQVRQFLLYSCNRASVGEPIINLENNKVIGITIKKYLKVDNYIGTFLKYDVDEINKIKNQIRISLEVNNYTMDNNVYFLNNIEGIENTDEIKKNNLGLKELNENNVKLYINGVAHKYQRYFTKKKKGNIL